MIWMTGGPGCSSEVALFFENGPYVINSDNKTLSWNDFGWDMVRRIAGISVEASMSAC